MSEREIWKDSFYPIRIRDTTWKVNAMLATISNNEDDEKVLEDVIAYFEVQHGITPYEFYTLYNKRKHCVVAMFEVMDPYCIHTFYSEEKKRWIAQKSYIPLCCDTVEKVAQLFGAESL